MDKAIVLEIRNTENKFTYLSNISTAISKAEKEIEIIEDTIATVEALKPDCDKTDYALAACSGALCGLIDVFLVAKPGESLIGNATDKWFGNRTCDFAKLCGWSGEEGNLKSAVRYLETHFKVPYDQRGCGDAGSFIFDLNPSNHHFKSLGHQPTLLGLFFSILDQFTNSSHFVTEGNLIELTEADNKFELKGNSFPAKLWCGFVNWFCHIISDASGASGSIGRGTGIPSPFMSWTNSIIAIKAKLGISSSEFDKTINQLALDLYKEGFDLRFQIAQAIPVFINELIVRLCYSIRRCIRYLHNNKENRNFHDLWKYCKPYGNPTIKRMLTIAHGTFCLIDVGDATIRAVIQGGGNFNPVEFFLRINIVGVGRFTISLYGEAKRGINYHREKSKAEFAQRRKTIIEDYLSGLRILEELYDDKEYLNFLDDICKNDFTLAFEKTSSLAKLRNVPEDKILNTKEDIDNYFNKRS